LSQYVLPRRNICYVQIMRLTIALLFFASPAAAWEFSAAPICTLTQTSDTAQITVTYDAVLPEYQITITLTDGVWPDNPAFGMAFAGDLPINIQTSRHQISPDGRSLTVTDSGFGNVLDGLQYNSRAYAISGDTTVTVPLDGIADAITAFRACPDLALT
jgi:hypothetical protein